MTIHFRNMALTLIIALAAGCSLPVDPDEPPVAMGDFRLGHNIVVVNEPTMGPFSRTATDEELRDALTEAVAARFGSYEGEKFYNLGLKIDAYALAMPGVPIVFNPKSVFVVTANIWDDAAGEVLNEEAKVFTVFEGVSDKTLVSSGLTQNKAKQMANLSANTAKAIQDWILENPEWIGLPPLPEETAAEPAADN